MTDLLRQFPSIVHCQHSFCSSSLWLPFDASVLVLFRSQNLKLPSLAPVTKQCSLFGCASATVTSGAWALFDKLCSSYSPSSPRRHHLRANVRPLL